MLQVFTVFVVVWQMFAMNVTLALWVTLGVVPTMTILTMVVPLRSPTTATSRCATGSRT